MWLGTRTAVKDDDQLLDDYYAGDRDAIGRLFERHVKTVYGVCLFYFREKEKARDAVMHIFEKLFAVLGKEKVRRFQPWLACISRNHCISELRKERNHRILPEHYLGFEITETTIEEEERVAAVGDEVMLQHLEQSLPQLKEKQRVCVTDFYLAGLTYREISEKRSYSVPEVKSYIQNARRNLKLLIEEKLRNEKRKSG